MKKLNYELNKILNEKIEKLLKEIEKINYYDISNIIDNTYKYNKNIHMKIVNNKKYEKKLLNENEYFKLKDSIKKEIIKDLFNLNDNELLKLYNENLKYLYKYKINYNYYNEMNKYKNEIKNKNEFLKDYIKLIFYDYETFNNYFYLDY